MLDQRFTAINLHKSLSVDLIRRHELIPDEEVSVKERYIRYTSVVERSIERRGFCFSDFNRYIHKKTKKITFSFSPVEGFEGDIVSRRLNFLLRRIFRINFQDRSVISRQIKSILSADFSGHFIRLDISSFYESLNAVRICDALVDDRILDVHSKDALVAFFDAFSSVCTGLPRGISLSSTLAEVAMRSFDQKVSALRGVYYYARYVDDIVLLVRGEGDFVRLLEDLLSEGLSRGLVFNNKTQTAALSTRGHGKGTRLSSLEIDKVKYINYLGYKYIFSNEKINKSPSVRIDISENKVKKIKTKIHLSFYEYTKDSDLELLFDRLYVLSSSYPVEKSDDEAMGTLKGGLCYVYENINYYQSLKDLDRFLCSYLQRRGLGVFSWQFSFYRNFRARSHVRDITSDRMAIVTRAWKNV